MTACTRQKSEPQKNGGIEMAKKYELISDLYEQIIVDVTKEARAWQSFLRTALCYRTRILCDIAISV